MKRYIFIIIGCLTLALGTIGVVLPILPTVPFYLITLFCFANSSEKMHSWFINTKLYKNNLESFVEHKGMTRRTKFMIMSTITILMAVGVFMMLSKKVYIPCIILAGVWFGHILYFRFRVKTINE